MWLIWIAAEVIVAVVAGKGTRRVIECLFDDE